MESPVASLRAAVGAIVLFAWPTLALAKPFYVESAGVETREEAQAQMTRATAAQPGVGRARVLRRYVRSEGWRYLVHVDDVAREKDARALAAAFGAHAVVIDLESGVAIVGDADAPVPPPPPQAKAAEPPPPRRKASPREDEPAVAIAPPKPPPAPPAGRDRQREAEGLLHAAAAAHGGATGGLVRLSAAPTVTFAYTRRVPAAEGSAALVAEHVYQRAGTDAIRLDVHIKKGDGVDSSTVVTPEGTAWVRVKGETTDRDHARTLEVLSRFGPDELLNVPLALAQDLEARSAWTGLEVVGPEGDTIVLKPVGATAGQMGLVDAAVYRRDHQLARVSWRRGRNLVVYRFSDYTEMPGGVVLPKKVVIEADGELVETITIDTLDLLKPVSPTIFAK